MGDDLNPFPPFVSLLAPPEAHPAVFVAMDATGNVYEYVQVRNDELKTHADTPAGHGAHGWTWVWRWHSNVRDSYREYLTMRVMAEGR